MSKPSQLPRWAETAGGTPAANIVAPNGGKQDTGYTTGGDVPTSGVLNWLFNTILAWVKYINGVFETATAALEVTGAADRAGVAATGGTGNSFGVMAIGGATDGDGLTSLGTGHGVGLRVFGGASTYGTVGGEGIVATAGGGPGIKCVGNATRAPLNLAPQTAP